jgi:hypothetical protein
MFTFLTRLVSTKLNIVTTIEFRTTTMGWAGHVVRMSVDRTIKKVFLGKPDGRGKAGRPQLRWLDCIENDLNLMVVKRWRKRAEDICMGRHSEGGTG